MAANATRQSLWLPGFGPDSTAFPDLFADAPMAPPPPSPTTEASIVPSASEISKFWRPSLLHSSTPSTPAFRAWPEWDLETLAGLRGSVTKFEANLTAARALKHLENEQRQPTRDERIALRRFTGWGGIPAAFNDRTADEAWRARAIELVEALSPGELESAKALVNNSHYTDPAVIGWIWRSVRRLGFTGGRLEPSAGTGHFLGLMPAELATASQVTAVELDVIAGRILRALYAPFGVDVRIGGFEDAPLPDAWFDLVVSNVPFGNYQVSDARNRPYSRFNIHAWFFGRALDVVRDGGLFCFITSAYLMDAMGEEIRAYLASQATLVTAFRLPAGTFSKLASTDVHADLLILRKRGMAEGIASDWVPLAFVPETMLAPRCRDKTMRINAWFVAHPHHVLGRIDKVSRGYEAVPTAVLDGDLDEALAGAAQHVRRGQFTARTDAVSNNDLPGAKIDVHHPQGRAFLDP